MERPVTLAPATWSALERCARDDDVTIGQIIRDAIDRELYRRSRAKKAVRPDERLIAPLRALLADDFAYARSWSDLASRLGTKGYRLVESGPGLVLVQARDGTRLCKASDLGYSHARLGQRLGPFPQHAHAHVVRRQIGLPG
jgi:hypothetical protein